MALSINSFNDVYIYMYVCNIVAIKMNSIKQYRRCVTVVLLLLYAFIATPVQLWHHHDVVKQSGEPGFGVLDTFTPSTDTISEGNCLICHHQYSVYNNDVIIPAIIEVAFFSSQDGYCMPKMIHIPSFSFQNRGPPIHF